MKFSRELMKLMNLSPKQIAKSLEMLKKLSTSVLLSLREKNVSSLINGVARLKSKGFERASFG